MMAGSSGSMFDDAESLEIGPFEIGPDDVSEEPGANDMGTSYSGSWGLTKYTRPRCITRDGVRRCCRVTAEMRAHTLKPHPAADQPTSMAGRSATHIVSPVVTFVRADHMLRKAYNHT